MKKILLAVIVAMTAVVANAQFWVGGSFGLNFIKPDYSNSEVLTNFTLAPEVGYKINDKWDVAVALNESFIAVDGEFYNTFTFEPYARYTFAKTGIASFFVDGGIGVGASGFEGDDVFGDSRFNFYLGFRPGVNIALSQKVGMVAKLGFIGYEFVDDAYHTFGINLNNSPLTFGMYYNF